MMGDPIEVYNSMDGDAERIIRSVGLSITEPAVKMRKEGGNLVIELDMPGVSEDDIIVSLKKDRFSVSAEKTKTVMGMDEDFSMSERISKCYRISEALPARIMPENAIVRYEIGTLRIEAPLDREAGR